MRRRKDTRWNIPAQGHSNTSHGCINVGPTYIFWFYDTFGAGDVVNVTGTNRHLDKRNGLGDWVVSWNDWLKGSALPPPPAPSPTPSITPTPSTSPTLS